MNEHRTRRARKRDRAPALMRRPIGGVHEVDCREVKEKWRAETDETENYIYTIAL